MCIRDRDNAALRQRNRERMGGGGVSEILQPVNGYRGQLTKAGKPPKDHARANIEAMREAQRQNRSKKMNDEINKDAEVFKLKQFCDVPSQVKRRTHEEQQASKARRDAMQAGEVDGKFLKARARDVREAEKPKPKSAKPVRVESRKSNLPVEVLRPAAVAERPQRNFQRENASKVIAAKKKAAAAAPASSKPADYGKVPKYLRARQEELAEEQRELQRLADIDVDCPPGMRLLPEAERKQMLRTLEQNREKVANEIAKLPFVIDTVGLRKKKQAMENKIKEIDDASRIFSRKKVYVEQ
eukprot:TRINITY_DN643_c0_g1_i3.p1 TRINITY_DN643_c0_g1~~TRINITY_DN643_c0_g1_i3.p1  ORF type:complete len:299 (-),score=92.72 TRINITY_DN643_c0_g1_i3:73-969(-)